MLFTEGVPVLQHHRSRRVAQATSLFAVAGLALVGLTTSTAEATPASSAYSAKADAGKIASLHDKGGMTDNLPSPLSAKQDALKQQALAKRLKGDATMQGKVAKIAPGQYVELQREATDPVFVVIVEFGDTRYPNPIFQDNWPGLDDPSLTSVKPTVFDGPLHNQIVEPDRSVDNSTLWQADYNREHYVDMYFNRMAKYYQTQSSNRYSVTGEVHGWVKVPFNEALYGRNYCGGIVCPTSKALARDAMAVWVQQQLAAGLTLNDIRTYLKKYDVWDRYDLDGDGDFNEPDGYIDHMQIVHAGGDEAAGDPHQGSDAIWSHRWYANLQAGGPGGITGVNIGSNGGLVSSSLVPNNPTGVWLGDYTVQPENGGLGVFAHEYGHDLGLPDLYDTSGNTGGAENSTSFWTLMSSGANIGAGGSDGIGDAPTDLSSWELLQLGWLAPQGNSGPFYEVARAGTTSNHKLGPNVPATKSPQAIIVTLPDKKVDVTLGAGAEAGDYFWSGRGNMMTNTMTAPATAGSLTAKVRYDIETDFDYAFVEANVNGAWVPVATNRSSTTDPNGNNPSRTGITGRSPNYPAWVDLTATLPAGTTQVRFRYATDPYENGVGLMVDSVAVGGTAVADSAWTLDGFQQVVNGVAQLSYFNAYLVENRQYDGYDRSLRTAYNFGFLPRDGSDNRARPDWVEFYPYQNGALIWYWDSSYGDNNVGEHPGGGLLLPVDAHPTFFHTYDGHLMRPRILSFDSTFGNEATDAITVHKNSIASRIPSQKAVPVFDDTKDWWFANDGHPSAPVTPDNPYDDEGHIGRYEPSWVGVKVPKTGTTITVKGSVANGGHLNITVAPK